jgi:hypothetical protein
MTKLESKKAFSDKTILLLCILNLLFLLYYLMLAFYSRFHFDDLHFLWRAKEMSFSDFVSYFYQTWSGRFISYLKVALYSDLILTLNEHRFIPIIFWLFGVGICWYIAKSIFTDLPKIVLLNIVFIFYNLYVLTNIDFAIFNWLCALDYYLLAPILMLTIYLLNRKEESKVLWLVLIFLFLIIGGGQEAFTPIALAALFINGMYYLNKYQFKLQTAIADKRLKRIVIGIIIILTCFIVVIIAPGNYNRIKSTEFVTPPNISTYILGYIGALSQLYYQLAFYLPYYCVLAILFLKLGLTASKKYLEFNISYSKIIIYSFIIYIIYVLLSLFPSVYLWSGFGVQRNYTPIVFSTMIFFCFHAFLIGYFKSNSLNFRLLNSLLNYGLILLICIMAFNLYFDTTSAKAYAKTVDDRLEYLQDLNSKGVTGLVEVNPITIPYTADPKYILYKLMSRKVNPRPVLYYISDVESIPNDYSLHYKRLYGFNFDIKLK